MNQISRTMDAILNEESKNIGDADQKIQEATADKNSAWDRVIEIFNEVNIDRFIAEDGHSLTLQTRTTSPKLNVEELQRVLYMSMTKTEADKIWNKITKRMVDPALVEEAVRKQILPADIVEKCMTPASTTLARVRREWTKEDKEKAQIYGIEKK